MGKPTPFMMADYLFLDLDLDLVRAFALDFAFGLALDFTLDFAFAFTLDFALDFDADFFLAFLEVLAVFLSMAFLW